jgi:uncharacterized protein
LGYAGLVMAFLKVGKLAPVWKGFAAVGRLALTNYLMQSIICMLFFTGFGMGYYGRLEQYQLYIIVAEIWIVQAIFSLLWLRKFSIGPAEWLWRCMIYSKWLPIKKEAEKTSAIPVSASAIL